MIYLVTYATLLCFCMYGGNSWRLARFSSRIVSLARASGLPSTRRETAGNVCTGASRGTAEKVVTRARNSLTRARNSLTRARNSSAHARNASALVVFSPWDSQLCARYQAYKPTIYHSSVTVWSRKRYAALENI